MSVMDHSIRRSLSLTIPDRNTKLHSRCQCGQNFDKTPNVVPLISIFERYPPYQSIPYPCRSSLIDTVPLFSRIELPCVSFILHPPSAREAIERLLEEERDYLLVVCILQIVTRYPRLWPLRARIIIFLGIIV